MMHNSVIYIAKKEFMDNIRNKWIIILSTLFAVLTIVFSLFGAIFSTGWQDIGGTISSMMSIVNLLVPIIALILGYGAVIGEIEKGSMNALLALPTTRLEIILGKLFGLGSILSASIIIGFGTAGVIISLNISDPDILAYLVFMFATILLGLVFLSMAIFFSTLFKKRSSAIGGAILLWILFIIVIPTVIQGMVISEVGIDALMSGKQVDVPDWYYTVQLSDPGSIYQSIISLAIPSFNSNILFRMSYPEYYTPLSLSLLLVLWVIVFFLLSYWRFSVRDI
ncbi:MAG: ABC transporter permease subunit [Candidatus Thermoplasmatota archaeon]